MQIIPAIDLRHGNVVQLVGGDPDHVAVTAERTPVEQAEFWRRKGAKTLHVVDLDGAFGEANQWPVLSRILGVGLPVHFGGGVRSMLDVQKLLDLGVNKVIIGTQGVRNPAWLRELTTLWPGRIMLAVDADGRDVMVKGWTESTGIDVVELAASLDDAKLGGFLYTNVAKEGRMDGIDGAIVTELLAATPNTPLVVSGGVGSMEHIEQISVLDAHAVVLGMSIYTDAIDLEQAIIKFQETA